MTVYPTLAEVVFAHDSLIAKFGGSLGIRDDGLLESAVFRCQATFGGADLYQTIFDKAAAILHSVLFDHPFVDGNKRTAVTSAATLLEKNGWKLTASQDELVAFPLAVEKTRPEISEIASWLRKHSRRIRRK